MSFLGIGEVALVRGGIDLEPLGTWEEALGREKVRIGATGDLGRGSKKRKSEV